MAVRTETSPPRGPASELASRVAPRRRGATVLDYAVTTAGDGPTSRRTNFAISREGSRSSGAAASPRSARSGLFSTVRTHAARGGGIRRGGVWNTAEERRKSTKIWRNITWGFGGLQPLEIPQHRQSFVWKSLDENTLDLEKLGEMQGGSPLFSRICSSIGAVASVSNGSPASWRKRPSQTSAELVLLGRRGPAPGRPPPRGAERRRCSVYAALAPDFTNL